MGELYLLLVETSGNQKYIFSTNRLKENVGASELTYRSCRDWVQELAKETRFSGTEVLLAVSGKAYVKCEKEDVAREFVGAITLKALREAPGLDLSAAFVKYEVGDLHAAIARVHSQLANVRSGAAGVDSRFSQLPIIDICSSSGKPAFKEIMVGRERRRLSRESCFKRDSAEAAFKRLKTDFPELEFPAGVEQLAEKGEWLAVVHADGNDLGRVFQGFKERSGATGDEEYAQKLQDFSSALEQCTREACQVALKAINSTASNTVRALPLILGGDDLTLLCLGRDAITFTSSYLEAFQQLTSENDAITVILPEGATACAGIAVVKPHHPFSAAYDLAEDLAKSAKQVKEKCPGRSALDFHVVYDSSPTDLSSIRAPLTLNGKQELLFGGPYILPDEVNETDAWARAHCLDALLHKARGIRDDRASGSQVHTLRENLFSGRAAAEARYELVRNRISGLTGLLGTTLFTHDGDQYITQLIDAVDAAGLV